MKKMKVMGFCLCLRNCCRILYYLLDIWQKDSLYCLFNYLGFFVGFLGLSSI